MWRGCEAEQEIKRRSADRIKDAANETTGKILPRGGDQKSEDRSLSKFDIDSQEEKADHNGVSRFTQWKHDRLARDFRDAMQAAPARCPDMVALSAGVDAGRDW